MKSKLPSVSIVIPVVAVNDYIQESIPKILELDWPDYEIIVIPDKPDRKHRWPKTKIIASGKVGPAEKRDMTLKYARGEILAFLDDDAYPEPDWLRRAVKHFRRKKVAAVGGPAMTPADDDVLQKTSGAVFESFLGAGGARSRYLPIGKPRRIDDWPTVNFLVRFDAFAQLGGFDSSYWPGEDTKLCLDLINAGYEIVYEPKAIVYHHRRSNLRKHFYQIGNYALHRGHFARIYPETSRRLFYFVPLLFDLYLLGLIVQFSSSGFPLGLVLIPLLLYLVGVLVDGSVAVWRWRNPLLGILTPLMILLTHVWYGIRFGQGFLTRKLASQQFND
ncbi:MAG: glycosyltransferase [Patescibacteria group bacterium]